MSRILVAVLVVAAVFGVGFAIARGISDLPSKNVPRSLEDRSVVFDGRTVTCASLFAEGCGPDLQLAFDRWGGQLDVFASRDLGPWGRGLSRPAAVKLGLEACDTASMPGRTFLEFVETARIDHPDASSPELFPFWNEAGRALCPSA
ncbi:hypothetical protein ABI214_01450 [Prescottella soli]|uniref:Uncharacterized protein n=1 Tax=Prescottella soli TaxID=1543852 RepID=A0ABW9FY34_9NOCA